MEKIKVYLQYPWKFPDSPYYKYLIDNPPEGIEYINAEKQKGVITNYKKFWFSNFLKKNIRRFTNFLTLSIPNAHLTKTSQDYDLIHCAHCLSKNKNRPWIADFESEWQFYIGKKTKRAKEKVKKILMSNNCKKILAWTEETKRKITGEFPEIKDKIGVVYPAVPLPKIKKKKHEDINLLFIARYFYEKGGLHALESINQLTKKYGYVKGVVVSEVPEEILKKYSQNKKIFFYRLMPQKRLFEEIFSRADIFVYPGYSDSFGFSFLESMSFGIPIITTDGFARKELVKSMGTGLIVEKPHDINYKILDHDVINKLIENCSKLIENKKLREKMAKNCIEIIKNGRFSIKERSKRLEKIYKGALG